MGDGGGTEENCGDYVQEGQNVEEEPAVVVGPDTVADEGAVVVEHPHTLPTDPAQGKSRASWRKSGSGSAQWVGQ